MGGSDEANFWADELFVSTPDRKAAQGELTRRHHLDVPGAGLPGGTQRKEIIATDANRYCRVRETAGVGHQLRDARALQAAPAG